MKFVLTTSQMRNIDHRTINEFGLPSRLLMESAGQTCADEIIELIQRFELVEVLVLCGRGNNGGDGAVIARWLHLKGFSVYIILTGRGKLSPDAAANLKLCKDLDIEVLDVPEEEQANLVESLINPECLVVDAIFGTGFKGPLREPMRDLIAVVNDNATGVVSIDIPSGLDGDTGTCDICIEALVTLAIGSYKYGHFVGERSNACGILKWIPLSIPEQYFEDLKAGWIIQREEMYYPPRDKRSHKGDFGRVFIFGGTRGYTGAAALSARAALRAGAGYVYVMHRKELGDIYAIKLTEAITIPIDETDAGLPDTQMILEWLEKASSVVIGPGFGKDAWSLHVLKAVLESCPKPVVVDGDALNLISENPELLVHVSKDNILLTPHWGEFCRLAGCTMKDLNEHYMQVLCAFVNKYKAQVLLKSHFTMYKDTEITILARSGNDGLATGGSGDVLTGIIASFIAQNTLLPIAASRASMLMGMTADYLTKQRKTASILPSDIIEYLLLQEEE